MNSDKGILFGVSVGPGDPELLTLKAKRILERCTVLAAPKTHKGNTLALDIINGAVDTSQKEMLLLPFQMTTDEQRLQDSHRQQADMIIEKLSAGKDVALISLGDVSVFSTFVYVGEIVQAAGYRVDMIPGVTSFCASACALGISLTTMRQPLHVIPAVFEASQEQLDWPGTKVLMKSASRFDDVRKSVLQSGQQAAAVVNCGLDSQQVYTDIADMPDEPGYFTTIIVKESL